MWPKAFAQLVELAPHISRLLPLADRFFQNKAGADDANRRAIDSMAANLRADLNQVNVSQAALADQFGDIGKRLTALSADTQASRLSTDSLDRRLTAIEARQRRLSLLVGLAIAAIGLCLELLAILVARGR